MIADVISIGITDQLSSQNRSGGTVGGVAPSHAQQNDTQQDNDDEMIGVSAGASAANDGPFINCSFGVIPDVSTPEQQQDEPANANVELPDSSGATIDGIGGNDSATVQTAFPGHGLKTGRKSYFSQLQMDLYVQNLQPGGKF